MRTETVRYARKVVPKLYPGELLLVATQVKLPGQDAPEGAGRGGGARWWSDADSIVANVPARRPVVWVLTDERMLVFPTDHLRDSDPLVTVRRENIVGIEATPAKVVFATLSLTFADGSSVDLDLLTDRELGHINDAARILLGH